MDCIKYRKLISAYVDNELEEIDSEKVISHLLECKSCKLFYENLLLLKDDIKEAFSMNNYDYDCSNQIMSKLVFAKPTYNRKKFSKIYMAIAVIFLITISFLLFKKTETQSQMASEYKLEKYVAEHLEKNRVIDLNKVTNVSYDK